MTNLRINTKIDEKVKKTAQAAAAIRGMKSLTAYVVHLIEKDASRVLKNHEPIKLSNDEFEHFIAVCNSTEGPNRKLLEAGRIVKAQGIR